MISVNRMRKLFFGRFELIKVVGLVFLFIYLDLFAQDALQNQYEYSSKLFDEEKYFDAITEFKRLQFFDSLKQYSYTSSKLIGLSYKQGGKFSEAIYYFTFAEMSAPNSDSLFNTKIEVIKTNLLRRTTHRAFDLLNDLNEDERFLEKKDQLIYWKGWAFIFNDEWEEASAEFAKLEQGQRLNQLCANVAEAQYSESTAKILSYILPGAGQIYTGNLLSGILSLGWVALWTYVSVEAFIADRVFDGLMVAYFLAFRFYNGNVQNAQKFSEEHNQEISNWMLNYLHNNYLGQKP
jgi:hypothetical protein